MEKSTRRELPNYILKSTESREAKKQRMIKLIEDGLNPQLEQEIIEIKQQSIEEMKKADEMMKKINADIQ